ncbi:MAG: hypothetical protein A2655_02860 [Candidatus Yanofskybacteria bacterium RIFCSPHIGHO2_01_FULL_43_42]|uniref:Uncharacterized protein n=1 Tax=Candidatus Yanofskybacteria bacterium RIFCSPLOWO2_01_FULL_43_22 TaxID=1802695 RepID=A0A1F8GGX4_9BACT|nr:MAG: hypothetical protein A2655_02860 [Candidatus Yanofskybacteria bacterium RIFCSPHIGHO2_01_FULL_43_42]OGN12951.1 MAG: hypothetical protein A3D48_03520 [Candidatus Yanofskybacteria bacterium RIFCSPHIGHO2_02_FULL_43_17]OGN23968.1 MAG: hypothetical protein A3A13_02735 [Candidatus Yanofskybacteria bacterium RIFCSPLOWO2_01_FULL_43_22]
MARVKDRRLAIKLREQGKSWTEIRSVLTVSKDTLSRWLKDACLTEEQRQKIVLEGKTRRIENYILSTKARRKRIDETYLQNKAREFGKVNKRDFLVAGLFLYLGEGAKSTRSRIQITNSDPSIIQFSIYWLTKILKIPYRKIKVQLHLYTDMAIEREIDFWQKITMLNRDQFIKPYIKRTSSLRIDHPSFGHGTCSIYYHNAKIKDEIMAGIKVIMNSATRL